jgi:hypothetical protein
MADTAYLKRLTIELTEQGKLMEAGWVGLRIACGLQSAPPEQLREMRMAFFAGAQHLLGSMGSIMDDDREPTENDLRRMELIHAELNAFIADFTLREVPTQGGVQ